MIKINQSDGDRKTLVFDVVIY